MVIVFHLPDTNGVYVDAFVPLAEGLVKLGVRISATRNYWRESPDAGWLFEASDTDLLNSAEISVFSNRSFQHFNEYCLPIRRPLDWLDRLSESCFNVLIDNEDGNETICTPHYAKFDLVLRSHLNRIVYKPSNVLPWTLGFGYRVISAANPENKDTKRNNSILLNFGASHGFEHGTRNLFTKPFLRAIGERLDIDQTKDDLSIPPLDGYDHLMWVQTQKRHSRSYYERLKSTQAIATFCGDMIPPAPFHPTYLAGGGRAKLKRQFYDMLSRFDPRPPRSIQWDSWRFWEGLAAGCLVFNIDLDYYGVELPVMPVNGEHYVGLRLDRMEQGVDEILSDPNRMEAIARQGREWAMENYSPMAMARRFLQVVESRIIVKR